MTILAETTDYDASWKAVLERYFPQFLEFFFPQIHAEIDWQRGWEFLDKELQQVVRDAEMGKRLVDKLVKVWRFDGTETFVLIHIEVQGQVDVRFAERMFEYHYRLRDRYNLPVVNLAVLADERQSWRPTRFEYSLWGCQVSFDFPMVKLLDYKPQLSTLEQNANPFAVVVMAHLQAQATRQNLEDRLNWKLRLAKGLYGRGYDREDILELFRFIDWILVLPRDLANRFDVELSNFEEERQMPYVTSVERRAIRNTVKTDILEILEVRFESVPESVVEQMNQIDDQELLRTLLRRAILIESVEAFQELLDNSVPKE
jgi:hypothetical protein